VAVGLGDISIVGVADCTVGVAVGLAVDFCVEVAVGRTVGPTVAVGLAVGAGLAVGVGQAVPGRPRPELGWTATAYGMPIRAAGTWLVVKALGAAPG
jgi:hypothetical protein